MVLEAWHEYFGLAFRTSVSPAFDPLLVHPRRDRWTAERQRRFIAALAETGVVHRAAAAAAGMSERSANRPARRPDAQHFFAWDAALRMAARPAAAKLYEYALGSMRRDGEVVYKRRRPSEKALIFLLSRLDPLRFARPPPRPRRPTPRARRSTCSPRPPPCSTSSSTICATSRRRRGRRARQARRARIRPRRSRTVAEPSRARHTDFPDLSPAASAPGLSLSSSLRLLHPLAQAPGPHVGSHLRDPIFARLRPADRQLAPCRPNRILLLVV